MLFLEKILSLLMFPIRWFWDTYEKYREERNILKIILLFICSLSGVAIIGFALLWLVTYLVNYHATLLVIGTLIIWLYVYVRSKMEVKEKPINQDVTSTQDLMKQQAESGYPIMRSIIYQTLRSHADSIGGVIPRAIQEVELQETPYLLSHGICFYQFRLNKADIRMQYNDSDLRVFAEDLQTFITRKILAGDFPRLQTDVSMDCYGTINYVVNVDRIEDFGSYMVIQAVFTSPAYKAYLREIELNKQAVTNNMSVPDASWKDDV